MKDKQKNFTSRLFILRNIIIYILLGGHKMADKKRRSKKTNRKETLSKDYKTKNKKPQTNKKKTINHKL